MELKEKLIEKIKQEKELLTELNEKESNIGKSMYFEGRIDAFIEMLYFIKREELYNEDNF